MAFDNERDPRMCLACISRYDTTRVPPKTRTRASLALGIRRPSRCVSPSPQRGRHVHSNGREPVVWAGCLFLSPEGATPIRRCAPSCVAPSGLTVAWRRVPRAHARGYSSDAPVGAQDKAHGRRAARGNTNPTPARLGSPPISPRRDRCCHLPAWRRDAREGQLFPPIPSTAANVRHVPSPARACGPGIQSPARCGAEPHDVASCRRAERPTPNTCWFAKGARSRKGRQAPRSEDAKQAEHPIAVVSVEDLVPLEVHRRTDHRPDAADQVVAQHEPEEQGDHPPI